MKLYITVIVTYILTTMCWIMYIINTTNYTVKQLNNIADLLNNAEITNGIEN